MLDTMILTLPKGQFTIMDLDKFSPSARLLFTPMHQPGPGGFIKCFQNPSRSDLLKGRYKPRLTLIKRFTGGGYSMNLKIEFSAPKILFGNNFDELTDSDYERMKVILQERLKEMGVQVESSALDHAEVTAIHFSKNFLLQEHVTSSMILRELSRLSLNLRLDLNKTDYRNCGHAVRYHANSYEVLFYDKIKDMEQARVSEKRTIEKDSLVQTFSSSEKLEVLRLEVRLLKRAKLKQLLASLGMAVPLTLQHLFNKKMSRNVLLHFWEKIQKESNFLAPYHSRPEEMYLMLQKETGFKPVKVLQILGAQQLINSIGIRGLRSLLGHPASRQWASLKRLLEESYPTIGKKGSEFSSLGKSLIEFSPLKLHSHPSNPYEKNDERLEYQRAVY